MTEMPQQRMKPESYSCSRCRRLKKKCPRQTPSCANCEKAHATCIYVGRAPRRTKRELEEARLRGEIIPHKKPRKLSQDEELNATTTSGSSQQLPTADFSGLPSMNEIVNSRTSSVPRTSISVHSPGTSTTSPGPPEGGVSSLISALSSLQGTGSPFTASTMHIPIARPSPGAISTLLNQAPSSEFVSPTSMKEPILSTDPSQAQHQQQHEVKSDFHPKAEPLLSFSPVDPKLINGQRVSKSEPHILHHFESIPIKAPDIETRTITSVFKGGLMTPWIQRDGSYKPIDRSLLDRFIAAYFKHNHRLFPMIDKIAFLNEVSTMTKFENIETDHDPIFVFEFYMIMAIGCTTLRRAGMLNMDEEDLSEHLSYLAMKNFSHVMELQNIETLRCLLLLGIYSFFEPRGSSSWTISGIIMRLTIFLGLNRVLTPKKMNMMSAVEVEARNRVFWSAYCFERLVSTCLGRYSAIDDDEITIDVPRPLYEGEKDEIEVTRTMIALRKIAGRIFKQVHSVSVSRQKLTMEERQDIIKNLRKELDDVYMNEQAKMEKHNSMKLDEPEPPSFNNPNIANSISYHSSDNWLSMRYAQLQILLYRPSTLIPKPPIDSLMNLGNFCLQAWKHTYTLYKEKLLPLNWITLFRTLTICNTILYCLCQWSIDLIESQIEIQQCVEILQHFGEKWIFASRCANVFQNISNTILDISLSAGKVPNMDKLTRELFGASDAYQDILDENNVDVSWVDKLM
ncbi:hypothetical protein NCAS_0D01290 [Naumovozyma castellii]|uniref:Zn(2)-C6 fungal-type domain-containing protein n=1 Tax=Naumovozyma castellii TaxID=27288 RepID=G0VDS1_NAUCA|nr:hypothetical protein NCAS_0D01290 [Naumovozyma castellii CBS 4309]CCC69710.1 hypothetical protein NCAS_0D01290 [Naumovozyma castellii CBS 4309]